jgi:hypothetical protein
VYAYGAINPGSIPKYAVFLIIISVMAMKTIKCNLFFKSLHLFSFFLYSHLRLRGTQLISQFVMTEMKFLLCNTFSECLIVNLTTIFHILKLWWLYVWFILPRRQSPPTKYVCVRFENSTLLGATSSTGNDKDTISCLSVLTECRSEHKF